MTSRPLPSTFLVPVLLAAVFSLGAAPATPTLGPDDLKPGQRAVVRTVFEGSRVEEFDAEIVAVMKGGRAEGDLILAKATSERVIKTGVAQGMSGSPVYVDGKLVGALSSGWSFSREPLFGVTPIGEMLAVLDLPVLRNSDGTAGPAGADPARRSVRFGEFRWEDDDATGDPSPAPPADSLRPGSAVAVDVLTGDVQMSAIGTVTWRDRDRVLIFGHPLFQSGDVRLPLSSARIATIVASDLTSFKLGVRGRPVGTATQDRRAAMSGRIGPTPGLLPITVDIATPSRARQRFTFGSIEDRLLAPQLVGIAALNSFLESGGAGGNQTLRWTLRLTRRGAPALTLTDVVAGDAPAADLAGAVAAPLRFLFNNPFDVLKLDSVSVAIVAVPGREQWSLRSARLLDASVRPGGTLRVECDVERWHGERSTVALAVTVPEEAPDGRYVLWLGGGPELSRYEAARLPGRYRPTSLDDAWRRLGEIRSGDALYATLFASAPEVTREGRDYPELPVSALALLAGAQGAGDGGRRGDAARLDQRRVAFAGPLRGELLLAVQVDSKSPEDAK